MSAQTFLSHFGLDSLRDLPDLAPMEAAGLLGKDDIATDMPIMGQGEEGDLP